MIEIKIPGKLFLSGEWSALIKGHSSIIFPVPYYVRIKIKPADKIKIISPYKNPIFVKEAIKVGTEHCSVPTAVKPFTITVDSSELKNYGLGSSAAVTVGTLQAIFKFHHQKISRQKLFKLAQQVHYHVQGQVGSGADIALAVWQRPLIYRNPGYVRLLPFPKTMAILVGYTGRKVSTSRLVKKINLKKFYRLFKKIEKTTQNLAFALKKGDRQAILENLRQNRQLLQNFSQKTKLKLETQKLRILADLAEKEGAAGKFSGAGGGDCGIAVSFNPKASQSIRKQWQKARIQPIM